jgi:hypothetical protein
MVPFVPIIQAGESPFSMFVDLQNKYDWVMKTIVYDTKDQLVAHLQEAIVEPALRKRAELNRQKAREWERIHISQFSSNSEPPSP